jgi:predicted phosphodiesterase
MHPGRRLSATREAADLTRLAVVADIHGNLPALEAVLGDARQQGVDQIVVAGDVASRGPFPDECLGRVTAERWPVIRGNGEYQLIDFGTDRADPAWTRSGQTTIVDWGNARTDPSWRRLVACWPDQLCLRFPDAPPLRVVHGSPRSAFEALPGEGPEEMLVERLGGVPEGTVVCGHTHEQVDRRVDRWRLLNPGAVGLPLDGDVRAQYMLLDGGPDGWTPSHRRAAYDVAETERAYHRQRLVEEVGALGEMVLRELRTARMHIIPFLRWRRDVCPDEPLSLELAARFTDELRDRYAPRLPTPGG